MSREVGQESGAAGRGKLLRTRAEEGDDMTAAHHHGSPLAFVFRDSRLEDSGHRDDLRAWREMAGPPTDTTAYKMAAEIGIRFSIASSYLGR